jgi:hypothetical protein
MDPGMQNIQVSDFEMDPSDHYSGSEFNLTPWSAANPPPASGLRTQFGTEVSTANIAAWVNPLGPFGAFAAWAFSAYREYIHWLSRTAVQESVMVGSVTAQTYSLFLRCLIFVPFVTIFFRIFLHLVACRQQHTNAYRLFLVSVLFSFFGAYLWYYEF